MYSEGVGAYKKRQPRLPLFYKEVGFNGTVLPVRSDYG